MSKIGSDVLKFDYKTYKESIKTYQVMYRELNRIKRVIGEIVGGRPGFWLKPEGISVTVSQRSFPYPLRGDIALSKVEEKLKKLGIDYRIVFEYGPGYDSQGRFQRHTKIKKIKFFLPWELAQALTDVG